MRYTLVAVLLLALTPAITVTTEQTSRERMRADLEFLTSPPLEGRASLGRGADASAWFLAAEMRKIGLTPAAGNGYLQPFDVVPVRLDRGQSFVRVIRSDNERNFNPGAVFFPRPTELVDVTADVVFAGYGITAPEYGYDDYAGIDVRGKAVLIFDHEPQEDHPRSPFNGTGFTLHANTWTKTRNAQQHGAAAILVVVEPMNRHRSAPRAPDRANAPPQALLQSELGIPRFSISPETADALVETTGRKLADWQAEIDEGPTPRSRPLEGVRVQVHAVNAEAEAHPSYNVAGMSLGNDPRLRDEIILVSAHYDHLGIQNGSLYAGANDNASGVTGMLETARQLAGAPLARSVLFVAFGSEEQLMLGSYHYVAHPLRPLATTRAVLNLDMIGRNEEHTPESAGAYDLTASHPRELNLVGAVFSPDLEAVLQRAGSGAGMTLSDKFDRDSSMRALFRCDHLPFLQKGIPAIWLFGGFHPGYHEPGDTVDRLDFDKLAGVVRLTVGAVRALAGKDAPPRWRPATAPAAAAAPAPPQAIRGAPPSNQKSTRS